MEEKLRVVQSRVEPNADEENFQSFYHSLAHVALNVYGDEGVNRNPLNALCLLVDEKLSELTKQDIEA
jgi:hypothetical protein